MTNAAEPKRVARIPIPALGWSLGLFLAITYTLCVIFDLVFPGQQMTSLWTPLLPWVDGISLGSYVLGLAETLVYGWFVALVFGSLFNFFAERS